MTTGPALGSGYEERRVDELRRWKLRAKSFLFGAFVVFLASHFNVEALMHRLRNVSSIDQH